MEDEKGKEVEPTHQLRINCGCGFTCRKIKDAKVHVQRTGHVMEIKGWVRHTPPVQPFGEPNA